MPAFHPFRGVRYDCAALGDTIEAVAAPPYDVIDDDQRVALERSHPHNAVRLILPRDEITAGDRYTTARRRYDAWLRDGSLTVDPAPRFYGYRMRFRAADGSTRETHGVLGAADLPVGDPASGGVLPHEQTMPKTKSDRLDLLRATRANLDPIWLLSTATGLTSLIDTTAVLERCTDPDGVEHTLFAIDDAGQKDAIGAVVASAPLVLADGHHRFETACAFRDELDASGTPLGGAGAILAFVVELSEEQLSIQPIHRLIDVAPTVDVRRALGTVFEFHDEDRRVDADAVRACYARAADEGGIVLVDRAGCARLVPRDVDAVRRDWPVAVADTDAAVVQSLAVPVLGAASWHFRHDAIATAALVEKGEADAALLLQPVSIATTRVAALAGDRMPPKTTFFSPKPRTGMVFRSLDL